ncbi:MAG: hypothetical protein JW818_18700 [Pirellulales bacterium]|nr:hypothetical protein [Pirellulales bacterium]
MNSEEVYKAKVIEGLQELSDEAFQRRAWLASDGSEVSSFSEAICGLFDDDGLSDDLERGKLPSVFAHEIHEGLRELGKLVDRAAKQFHSLPPLAIIDHPQMQEIRTLAAEVLAKIR